MKPENARKVALASMASRTMGPIVGMENSRRRPVRPEPRPAGAGLVPPGPGRSSLRWGPSWPAYWLLARVLARRGGFRPGVARLGGLSAGPSAAASGAGSGVSTPSGSRSASTIAAR